MVYIPHTPEETKEMLSFLGLKSIEELYSHIDKELMFQGKLNLNPPYTEWEIEKFFKEKAKKNQILKIFAGAGSYDRYIPAVIDYLVERGEFLTSYTPYQPEVSQGTLTAIFEYQTLIAHLTGMDIANASMYDGGSALAEAILMSKNIHSGNTVVLSQTLHPYYREVVKTYLRGLEDEIVEIPYNENGITDLNLLEEILKKKKVYAVAIQYLNFFGFVEPLKEISELVKKFEIPFIIVAEPISLSILKPPSAFGADIVVGEGQPLGIPMSFGGPYLGFFATRKQYLRKIPGRLVGMAEDIEGKRAFTLVLQTREQHIRREKATSNICSNQNLMALRAVIYMSLLGMEGLRKVAQISINKARYFYNRLKEKGLNWVNPFNNEKFLWEFPLKKEGAKEIRKKLLKKSYLFGIEINKFYPQLENTILVAITEKRTKEEIDELLNLLKENDN